MHRPSSLPIDLRAALAVVIVAITVLRLAGLERLPVWHDEAHSLVRVLGYDNADLQRLSDGALLTPADLLRLQQPDAERGWPDTLHALAEHPEHAPLYYLLGHLSTRLPLDPVVALRGTAAVFGLLLPLAACWLMRELFGRGAVPWVAALLLAVSPMHLLYAQEARQYALWTVLLLAASAALLRALRRGQSRDWWLYGLLLTLGLYSHLLFIALLPVHALYGWLAGRAPLPVNRPGNRPGNRPENRPEKRQALAWVLAVATALLLFSPWLAVLLSALDSAAGHTQWMERAVGTQRILLAWAQHGVRAFVDPVPQAQAPAALLWLWLPLGIALAHSLWRAPLPQRWFLPLLALAGLGPVLGPDLLLGGSRSLHVRYGLPAILGLQLMVAWSLGTAITRAAGGRSGMGPADPAGAVAQTRGVPGLVPGLVLVLVLGLGLWSQARILLADTWWTKQFSAQNREIARLANAQPRPLVVASPSGITTGELLSLAHDLDARVRIRIQSGADQPLPASERDAIVLLLPGAEVRDALPPGYTVEPVAGTWQWFLAQPSADSPPIRPPGAPVAPSPGARLP
ncbi:glycosyltransferase family 39 protein [Thiohalocapsa marina]|uniref:glycosyltransferase family 39 protein n=1 Tax=Thiohalocapsa marina TaxID=424902 RepID=UPI001478B201|nr:glycosyltransferase family 39 protein [Thiohalocapsa marina]